MSDRWLKIFRPRPDASLRLFCFPYAGGGASVYRQWPELLPEAVEVCSVQPPGRESRWREQAFRRMKPFADAAVEGLKGHLDSPFAFFGHSMGAALAFEVTRRLVRGGGPLPLHLFVSGRRGPRTPGRERHIHQLPRDEFIDAIRGYSGTPEEVLQHEELMELVEPLLRADFSVSETYEYTPDAEPLPVPITALGGVRDEDVSEEELAAWEQETGGPFRKVLFDGGHFFLTERRDEVLDVVRTELDALLTSPR